MKVPDPAGFVTDVTIGTMEDYPEAIALFCEMNPLPRPDVPVRGYLTLLIDRQSAEKIEWNLTALGKRGRQ